MSSKIHKRFRIPSNIKIPLRVKVIIFLIACAIGIFTLVRAGIQNRSSHPSNRTDKPETVIITSDNSKKNDEAIVKTDEDTKKKEQNEKDEQEKVLESRYNEGYEAFFGHKYSEAISIEEEVINKDSSFYKAYNLKGIALAYSGKYDEGMKNIDRSLELKPDFGYGIFNKALAYELYGRYDEAIEWYKKDLSIENYVWSYYGIASIYGRRGDVENTLKYLNQAAAIDNGVRSLAKDEEDFNPVKNSAEFQSFISGK